MAILMLSYGAGLQLSFRSGVTLTSAISREKKVWQLMSQQGRSLSKE